MIGVRNRQIYGRYRVTNRIKACILDWSGTVADRYVIAPAAVFKEVFEKHGVSVTMQEARRPMGLRKDLHIKEMLFKDEGISKRWQEVYGRLPSEEDADAMFADFVPMQLDVLPKYAGLIPGAAQTIDHLRGSLKIKVGSTTGFTREMVDVLEAAANRQGAYFDSTVAGDEVSSGARPSPHMVYKNLDLLGVDPIQSVVKVDDTAGGIGEGVNAGCWSVGVSRYSNYMDIDSLDHEKTLSQEELQLRNIRTKSILQEAGAHYVIDTIRDLPGVIEDIDAKLRRGVSPQSDNTTILLGKYP